MMIMNIPLNWVSCEEILNFLFFSFHLRNIMFEFLVECVDYVENRVIFNFLFIINYLGLLETFKYWFCSLSITASNSNSIANKRSKKKMKIKLYTIYSILKSYNRKISLSLHLYRVKELVKRAKNNFKPVSHSSFWFLRWTSPNSASLRFQLPLGNSPRAPHINFTFDARFFRTRFFHTL